MQQVYAVGRRLGKGSFGLVVEVQSSTSREVYAAKINADIGKAVLEQEADIHSRLVHPNILQFVSAFEVDTCFQNPIIPLPKDVDGSCGVMIIELCLGGTIADRLKNVNVFSTSDIQRCGGQIASGLLYLKEQGIIHRDIKPENILICGDFYKIGDFGVSKFIEDGGIEIGVGTPNFMALESFTGEVDFATDVYAFGITLYMMYAGVLPFPTPTSKADILNRNLNFSGGKRSNKIRDQRLENLIIGMLQTQKHDRISIEDVLKADFFAEVTMSVMNIDDNWTLDEFRNYKSEFGEGTREQFYYYLANKSPLEKPISVQQFTLFWDQL